MKKLYIILFISIFCTQIAFATISSIEQELTNCLRGKYQSSEMISCSQKATKLLASEINKCLIPSVFSDNQTAWNDYKTSTKNSIIKILDKEPGSIYQEFASSIIFNLNKNRLLTLDYLNNEYNYQQEKYISENLNNCLKNSYTTSLKTKCYLEEKARYEKTQATLLQQLSKSMRPEDYNRLKQNQFYWLKYKDNTIHLINNAQNLSNLQKAQIIKLLYEERYSQLHSIKETF